MSKNLFIAISDGDVVGVSDSLDTMYKMLSMYFGCEVKENLSRFRDIRDSGIECDFYIEDSYVCIQDFKLNEI